MVYIRHKKNSELKEKMGLFESEVSVDISFTAFFTVLTLFFISLLIKKFFPDYVDPSVKVSILFLIISTCGFLFSTLIYANSTGKTFLFKSKKFAKKIWTQKRFEKCILLGTTISEYMGVYFLILAIPLIINIITKDIFLRVSTLLIVLFGLGIYHLSGFAIMNRHFKHWHYHFILTIMILETLLFAAQFYQNKLFICIFSAFLVLFIFLLATYIWVKAEKVIENLEKKL
jgi:hypothetical protein